MASKRHKGADFERDVSRLLSLWVTDGKRNDVLWRSRTSGAMATMRKKETGDRLWHQAGDISVLDPTCKEAVALAQQVVIEAKFHKALWLWPESASWAEIYGYMSKAEEEGAGREPWLIYKTNNRPPILIRFDSCRPKWPLAIPSGFRLTYRADSLSPTLVALPLLVFLEEVPFKQITRTPVRG